MAQDAHSEPLLYRDKVLAAMTSAKVTLPMLNDSLPSGDVTRALPAGDGGRALPAGDGGRALPAVDVGRALPADDGRRRSAKWDKPMVKFSGRTFDLTIEVNMKRARR